MKFQGTLSILIFSFSISSCSLLKVEIESDVVPLSERQLNQRIAVHDFGYFFIDIVSQAGDSVIIQTADPMVKINALQWKMNVAKSTARTVFLTDPEVAFFQTWALVKGHQDFINSYGASLFAEANELPTLVADSAAAKYEMLAKSFYPEGELKKMEEMVDSFVSGSPIERIDLMQPSIVDDYKVFRSIPDSSLVRTVGSLPQVLANFNDQAQFATENVPNRVRWNLDAWRTKAYNDADLGPQLDTLRLIAKQIGKLAEQSPQLVDSAMLQLDASVRRIQGNVDQLIATFDDNWQYGLEKITQEREALTGTLSTERELVMDDLNKMAVNVTETALEGIKGMVGTVLVLVIVLILVLFGLPFLAGYQLARFKFRHKERKGSDPI